jgi:protein subunit release factor A
MFEKLAGIDKRYNELERLMSDPETMNDYEKIVEYSKERAEIEEIVQKYRIYKMPGRCSTKRTTQNCARWQRPRSTNWKKAPKSWKLN